LFLVAHSRSARQCLRYDEEDDDEEDDDEDDDEEDDEQDGDEVMVVSPD
jgi:hypothetical protein